MSDLSQQLFQAIDEIVSAKLNQVTFDKTVVCTVIEQVAEDPTLYWVNEGSVKFTARAVVAGEKYRENQKVYVTIPNGDYNLDKIIIGGYLAEKLPEYLYTDPFKKLAPAATIEPEDEIILTAAVGASNTVSSALLTDSNDLFQLTKPALGDFDYVGIKYSFDTQTLTEYKGNYALCIEFINGDNSYPVTLYSAQMAGNPYALDGRIFYNHLLPCPAGMPDGEYTITASLVLNNDFAEEDNGKTITCQVYALYLGYNVSAIEGKQELKIRLGEGESLEYKEANETRSLNATWLTDNNIYYIDNPHPERKSIFHPEYSVRWFRHRPGIEESKAQGWPVDKGWELLMYEGQGGVLQPYTYQVPNYALSTDRATDVLKAYVFVKNYKEDGNASDLGLKIYYNLETIKGWITDLKGALDSENIEVPTLIETLNQTVINSELFEKGEAYLNQFNVEETNTNHAIFQEIKSFTWYTCLSSLVSNIKQDININTEAISDTENNLVRSARNKINLRCDIALDTLEREGEPRIHLTSNELVFSNTATTATTNPEDEQATIIIDSSEGTTLNIYSVSSGDLLEDKLVTLTPRLSAAALEKGYNVSLQQGDIIKWTIPSTGTLIRELSVAGTNSSTPFEHTQTVGVNTEYSKYPLQIRFKSKYNSAATDNAVTCEVIRNGVTVVRGELNLIIGTTGTNGTQYSLNLEIISDNKYVVGPNDDGYVRPIRVEAVLRNTNGEKVPINPSNIEWKWFIKSYDLDFNPPIEIEHYYIKSANASDPVEEYSLDDLIDNKNTATPILKERVEFLPVNEIKSTCIDLIYNPLDISSYNGNYFHRAWGYWELTNTSILQCTIKGFEISAENSTKTVNLTQLLPIACGDEWFYDEDVQQPYNGPGTIVYDSGGNNAESASSTFKQAYSQYWEVLSPPEFKAFAPIITSETKTTDGKTETIFNLCPAPFIPAATIPAVACAKSDKDADGKLNYMYQQPILIYRNNYAIDLINNWSGALTIDNDNNAILAATMVAGSLDSSNKFTGAMIGKAKFDSQTYEGLLGMKKGNRTFSLDVEGNFFVGDLLGNRYISFNDNGLEIKTKNFDLTTSSGALSLKDDGTFKLNANKILIDSSPAQGGNYINFANKFYVTQSSVILDASVVFRRTNADGTSDNSKTLGDLNLSFTTEYQTAKTVKNLKDDKWVSTAADAEPYDGVTTFLWMRTVSTSITGHTTYGSPVKASGEKGPQGNQGPKGDNGDPGKNGDTPTVEEVYVEYNPYYLYVDKDKGETANSKSITQVSYTWNKNGDGKTFVEPNDTNGFPRALTDLIIVTVPESLKQYGKITVWSVPSYYRQENEHVLRAGYIYSRNVTIYKYSNGTKNTVFGKWVQEGGTTMGARWAKANNMLLIDGANLAANTVQAMNVFVDNTIESGNYAPSNGETGSCLDLEKGSFDSKYLQWDEEGKITATGGKIGGWNIQSNLLYSGTILTDGKGFYISTGDDKDSWICARLADNTYPFYVKKDGKLFANNAEIKGTIQAGSIFGSYGYGKLQEFREKESDISSNYYKGIELQTTKRTSGSRIRLDYRTRGKDSSSPIGCGRIQITAFEVDGSNKTGIVLDYNGKFIGSWSFTSSASTDSDINLKNTISTLSDSYSVFFDNLNPVTYKYNNGTSNRLHTGFIAQGVKSALDIANIDSQNFAGLVIFNRDTEDERWTLRYEEFVALNTWQIQKLKARVADLEAKLAALE